MTSTGSSDGATHLRESVAAFLTHYRQTFEALNADGLSAFHSYPALATTAQGDQSLFGSPADYASALAPLLEWYRELGLQRLKMLDLTVIPVASSLVVAVVDWEAIVKDDRPLYSVRASYTLVRKDEWRIAAIAFDELPKLQAALQAHREAQGESGPQH
jgi:hypothetical protein